MRIHTDTLLRERDIHAALQKAKDEGHVSPHVGFKKLEPHGSSRRYVAWEVQLEALVKLPGDGRRFGNSGQYGAISPNMGHSDVWAATYDEWGWFLASLFDADPDLSTQYYVDLDDFANSTTLNYSHAAQTRTLKDDPYPYVDKHGDKAGRMARRYSEDHASQSWIRTGCEYDPRSVEYTNPEYDWTHPTLDQINASAGA